VKVLSLVSAPSTVVTTPPEEPMPSITKGVANALGLRTPSGKPKGRNSVLLGKSPQERLSDRLCTQGMVFNKHARSVFGGVSKRLLRCDLGCLKLVWGEIDEEDPTRFKKGTTTKTMMIANITSMAIGTDVASGQVSPSLAKKGKSGSVDMSLCITLKDAERSLDLECQNRNDFEFLFSNLSAILV